MIKVGILGLDTSHSEKFAELISNRPDMTVGGVWDGGDVRSEAYITKYCQTNDAPQYGQPGEIIDHVDAAMVLTVNWDQHRPIASQFLEAGIPTFVDKPIAGSIDDVKALRRIADREGTPFCGGSSVPYHPALSNMRADDSAHDLFSVGYNNPFYYGVHITDTARKICGADWTKIEPADHPAAVTVSFGNGSTATLLFDGPTENAAFGLLDIGETIRTARINGTETELERMYNPFLDVFAETVTGNRDESDWLFDAATLLLGVQVTLEHNDVVTPGSPILTETSRDGSSFTSTYEPLY